MNVLSLFDGISCGMVALERAGITVDKYYASEIEPSAMVVAMQNHPNIIQIGDVQKVNYRDGVLYTENGNYEEMIDIVIGGSPCQGFSFAGRQLNFDDLRSKLFFEFVRILKEITPKYFLLENVRMKKEYRNVITEYLGVKPVEVDSALVSAQTRLRSYWCNWSVGMPEDRHIMLSDVLEDDTYINSAAKRTRKLPDENYRKSVCLEVNNRGKANCLMTVDLNNLVTSLPKGRYKDAIKINYPVRNYTIKEMCRLQTLPDNYITGMGDRVAMKLLGNCWTVDVVAYLLSQLN